MKRLGKFLFICFIGFIAFFLLALHCSWFQKLCLQSILRLHFQNVQMLQFQGGAKVLTAERIECKSQQETISLHSFQLEWDPWKLLFQRTLFIQNLQVQANILLKTLPTKPIPNTAGWGLSSQKTSKPFSFFQYLQPPIRLHIEQAHLQAQVKCPRLDITSSQIHIQNLVAGETGNLQYNATAKIALDDTSLSTQLQGNIQIQTDTKGMFQAIAGKGSLFAQKEQQKLPPFLYNFTFSKMQPAPKEKMRAILQWGENNTLTILGETLKTAEHWVDFHAQGFFDQTCLQWLPLKNIPTLSAISNTTCSLHRKTHRWQSSSQWNVWAKDFNPNNPNLPALHGKAQLNLEYDAQQIQLQQYDLQITENEQKHLRFALHSLYPLQYHLQKGFQGFPQKNTQLFTLTFYETPLEIFNPYLQNHGYQIQGDFRSRYLAVDWENSKRQLQIRTLQPFTFFIRQLTRNKELILSNIQGKFQTNNTWQPKTNDIQTQNKLSITNSQNEPFLQVHEHSQWKGNQLTSTQGKCEAKLDALSLQPFALAYPGIAGNFTSEWNISDQQKSVQSHLVAACTDLPFTTDLQAKYTQNQQKSHQIQGCWKLKHGAQQSDITFENMLDAKKCLTGTWESQQLFLQDIIGLGIGIGKIKQKFTQQNTSLDISVQASSAPNHSSSSLPLQGTCNFRCASIPDFSAQSIEGQLYFYPYISFHLSKGILCKGNLQAKADFIPSSSEFNTYVTLQNLDLKNLWALYSPLESYGQLEGTGTFALQAKGKATQPQTIHGILSLQANQGKFSLKNKILDTGQAVSDISDVMGILTGQTIPASSTVSFLSSYLQAIPFSHLSLEAKRQPTQPITFKANAINPDLQFDVQGTFETNPLLAWNQQPFVGHLQFRAPQQSPFTHYFSFDPNKTDAKGYGEGPHCTIDGTLQKPNYFALLQLLQPKMASHEQNQNPIQNLLKNSPVKKILDLL